MLTTGMPQVNRIKIVRSVNYVLSGAGSDNNHAHPDTSMKLSRNVHLHELLEYFSLASQNLSNFQDGGAKIQDGRHNKHKIMKWRFYIVQRN